MGKSGRNVPGLYLHSTLGNEGERWIDRNESREECRRFWIRGRSGGEGLQVTETYYRKADKDSNISVLWCSCVAPVSLKFRLHLSTATQFTITALNVQHSALSINCITEWTVLLDRTVCVLALEVVEN